MRYLVTGKNGQLARAFIGIFESRSMDYMAPEESHLDIADPRLVKEAVVSYRPDVIINCAAYNNVDKAEQEQGAAFRVNADGPGILAEAAEKYGALIVHFGTDYVFDGRKENGPYTEGDKANPINIYGRSKLKGEELIAAKTGRHLILRLSWLFGNGAQNFIYKLMEWAKRSEYLKIACDEYSVPTSADTAADVALKAVENGVTGLYHLTNGGCCSRYDWAKLVLEAAGVEKFIRPVSSDSFNLPAKRPNFSAMSNERISSALGISIPSWEEAVRKFVSQRMKTS